MSRRKGKGNKDVLASVNYSMDIIKRIKAREKFTAEEKQDILHKFVGTSPDNNSYFTPQPICNWIKQLLNIKRGRIADLSAGIGSMVLSYVIEYGKLQEGITFDLFELDENNSMAGKMAWSDYEQVNYYGNFNTVERADEIPDNTYDVILGNPPFSGSVPYFCDWNNNKGKAKNNNICDAFVDLAVRKVKDKGYIALVLPAGHLFKGNATAKLREWMKDKVALKGVFPLDEATFRESGILGTSVGTYLVVYQKGVPQDKVMIGALYDRDELVNEMVAIANNFQMMLKGDCYVEMRSDHVCGEHGVLRVGDSPYD